MTKSPSIDGQRFSFRRLLQPGRLVYRIEASPDLAAWAPANLNQIGTDPNGDGTETVTFEMPSSVRAYYRLIVILE